MSKRRSIASLIVLAGLLLRPPADLAAQEGGEPEARASITLSLGIGLLAPLADLTPESSGVPIEEIEPTARLSTGLAVSAGATLLVTPQLGVGIHGGWSNTDVDLGPAGTQTEERRLGGADRVTVAAEVVYRLLEQPVAGLLEPYVAGGGGIRHVSFSFEDAKLEDATDPMATVATGVRISLGGRYHWVLEIRDQLSVYEAVDADGQLQNDVTVTVGLGARL